MDYTSANSTNNIASFQENYRELFSTSLQQLPGDSNYSVLIDSTIYESPNYDIIKQSTPITDIPKKQKFDTVTTFYLGALTVVGLLIVYRVAYKNM
uniref:Uncharacterized protein n=1 Tax=viral metagenome TaxID=1070528 RepID=A0A6C0D3Y2_9ZZZZ